MASAHNSPVLVQHASPPHTLSPEVTVISIASVISDSHQPSPETVDVNALPTQQSTESQTPAVNPHPTEDTEMADASSEMPEAPSGEQPAATEAHVEEEQPQQEQEQQQQQEEEEGTTTPVPESTQTEEVASTDNTLQSDQTENAQPPNPEAGELPASDGDAPPPPPPPPEEPKSPEIPEWVTWEDDTSAPSEEEMKEIEAREEISAQDVPSIEKRIYSDVDDPDQRPVKKIRLSWVLKGVRGTKDKPNHARVMISPYAKVDGHYWQIKFYPRGNKCSTLSAYIRCSKTIPQTDTDILDSTFTYFEGPPEANLGDGATPTQSITTTAASAKKKSKSSAEGTAPSESQKEAAVAADAAESAESASSPAPKVDEKDVQKIAANEPAEDWRVSAQIGMVIYNPEEPRANARMSSEHQFAQNNDDWGWTNFCGPWNQIHVRSHGQRKPLLQNDTIAIDAYIRIFDDPSQSLWWHGSDSESQWPSRSLAGYFPMGTPPLYHSPAVAGMISWLLLAPFRELLQNADACAWRTDSQVRQRPVLFQLQLALYKMRHQRRERDPYVDVYPVIRMLEDLGETHSDVVTFWEILRRALELEFEDDKECLAKLASIFDTTSGRVSIPALPVESVSDVQQGIQQVLREKQHHGELPDFLPLSLARQKFDKRTREWKLLHDRIALNDEIDVSEFSAEPTKYVLYGFITHVGERNSGKFYSVLRPNGPNTKWLAFEDGDGNKVFSYTRKRLREYEGLEGQALKDFTSTRQTAYLAMYIKASRLKEYLPGKLEPYELSAWQKTFLDADFNETVPLADSPDDSPMVTVEVLTDAGFRGMQGLLEDPFRIKQQCRLNGCAEIMTLPATTKIEELRQKLASQRGIDNPLKIRLFHLRYWNTSNITNHAFENVLVQGSLDKLPRGGQPLCLWMSVLKDGEEVDLFAEPERPDHPTAPAESSSSAESSGDESNESSDAAESNTTEGAVEVPTSSSATEEAGDQVAGVAAPDAEQASVEQAVAADLERAGSQSDPATAQTQTNESADEMQLDAPQTSEIPTTETADVPHGHLVDAATHEDPTAPEPVALEEVVFDPATSADPNVAQDAVIDSVIADIAAGDDRMVIDVINGEAAGLVPIPEPSEAPAPRQGPVDNVYGFIQVFDPNTQSLVVHDIFFARTEDKVRDIVQKRLGYGDQDFKVWRREAVGEGTHLDKDDTFYDSRYSPGFTLVVSGAVPDSKVKQLEKEGKFSRPFELSKYLRMAARKHPVKSTTTTEAVEMADFGSDYYKGPLVNGQPHGENCLSISSAGHTYEGPLVCSKKDGLGGKMTYQNGDTYEGGWEDDERHGQGTFIEARTGNKYVGGFEYGKRWGMGTTYWQVADQQADLCQICASEDIDALFFDCGHVCSCVECARQCEICPICRRTVKQVVKMFRA